MYTLLCTQQEHCEQLLLEVGSQIFKTLCRLLEEDGLLAKFCGFCEKRKKKKKNTWKVDYSKKI